MKDKTIKASIMAACTLEVCKAMEITAQNGAADIPNNQTSFDIYKIKDMKDKEYHKICQVQKEIFLYVPYNEFKFIFSTIPGYMNMIRAAKSEEDLQIIDMGVERIRNSVANSKREDEKLQQSRRYAVALSLLSITALGVFLYLAGSRLVMADVPIPFLDIPPSVLIWSFVGSVAAILYRFTNGGSELKDPLKWLFARPLSGVIMGTVAYLILKVGFITIYQGNQPIIENSTPVILNYVTWLLCFLVGFSDRFTDALLKTVVGKYGGQKDDDLLTTNLGSAEFSVRDYFQSLAMDFSVKQTTPQTSLKSFKKQIADEQSNVNTTGKALMQ